MAMLDRLPPRTRPLAGALALAAACGAIAGCGGSKGGSEGGGEKGGSEAAPGAAIQPPEPGEVEAPSREQALTASEQREQAELNAIKQRRERIERELSSQVKVHRTTHRIKTRSGTVTHHRTTTHHKKRSSSAPGAKNKHETQAEAEARKRFEAEEAREAAEFKRQASKEK